MEQSPEIKELIKSVNAKFNKKPVSPSDFSRLSDEIEKVTGCPISVSTLKRLWGYVKGYANTRRYTYDVLCRYAGFDSWDIFLRKLNDDGAQSDFYASKSLRCDSLNIGDCVEVTWQPNRHCLFEYLGNQQFVVRRSENAKIVVGDRFKCDVFRAGQPLYLDEIWHEGSLAAYVAGRCNGVLFRLIPSK